VIRKSTQSERPLAGDRDGGGRSGMTDRVARAFDSVGPGPSSAAAVTFTVPGDPVPQPRPRVSTRGGFGRAYVPAKHPVHAFRDRVAIAARAAGLTRPDHPVTVVIEARFGRPRTHYRKAGVKPTAPVLPRPDCDNLAKAVLDGLQDVIGDDTKVSRLVIEKAWGSEGSTTVTVSADGHGGRQHLGRGDAALGVITKESIK
jgi:Holliday junction resolvase RusA-like endonuclease